jgi:hypothetical protein
MEGGVNARRIAVLAALLVMAASGAYFFVYLYRWEWNRALVSAVIFIAAEIGLLGAVMADRLARVERRLDAREVRGSDVDDGVRRRLRENQPEPSKPFAWLTNSQSTNVFVPVLLGAGFILSGLAWLVDRVARATAGPAVENNLASALTRLQPPAGGLLGGMPRDPYRPR